MMVMMIMMLLMIMMMMLLMLIMMVLLIRLAHFSIDTLLEVNHFVWYLTCHFCCIHFAIDLEALGHTHLLLTGEHAVEFCVLVRPFKIIDCDDPVPVPVLFFAEN